MTRTIGYSGAIIEIVGAFSVKFNVNNSFSFSTQNRLGLLILRFTLKVIRLFTKVKTTP